MLGMAFTFTSCYLILYYMIIYYIALYYVIMVAGDALKEMLVRLRNAS